MNIIIGVTGGISAYKVADLIGALRHCGHTNIKVVMTQRAKDFITPLTLASLSHHPIYDDLTEWAPHGRIDHIELADWANVLAVVPATANTIGKMANGISDNLLTSLYAAFSSEDRHDKNCVICPAMNTHMYNNLITRSNIGILLKKENHYIVGPVEGVLACGSIGVGKLSPTKDILKAITGGAQ